MKLKCKINNKEYDIVQGATFSEEYNETLDSGSIIIDQVPKINDLKPFDDVYIYDGEFKGYAYKNDLTLSIDAYTNILSSGIEMYVSKSYFTEYEIKSWNISMRIMFGSKEYNVIYDIAEQNESSIKLDVNLSKNSIFIFNKIQDGTLPESFILTDNKNGYYYYKYNLGKINGMEFKNFTITANYTTETPLPRFYKHLLVDQFYEENINLTGEIFKYKIELFSETKKLEMIQLPNISITQPLMNIKKISVYEYLVRFVNMYSPKIKIATDKKNKVWNYEQKYSIDSNLEKIFGNVYAPDFSLNTPTLKDVLSQLMLVKDMIPYVKDDVIYGMDITKRNGRFDDNKEYVNYISGSRSSDNHADNLRRNYGNALSQDKSCRMVEYLGFRNSDEALLTLDNMRLETRFPIYKINKIYLCYYKKGKIISGGSVTDKKKIFLCKQDITKLVKLDSERNLLSQDWNSFTENISSIDDLAKYKLSTVGYSIGSKYITGWGTKYSYPQGWWDVNKTYIENILTYIDNFNPYGIYQYGYITKMGNLEDGEVFSTDGMTIYDKIVNPFSNNSLLFKSMFFIVDYNSFYNGAVVHSKDFGNDDITINDNSSSSLTLLEQDGLFQKEKVNRFGNKAIQINARYDSIDKLQSLGSVYESNYETDVIIYHREYNIYDNVINAVYYGTKDYVLKNYFTNVYAKHRTYNLMSYNDSIVRAENKKMMVLLSKDNAYYENENRQFEFQKFNDESYLSKLMSFATPSEEALSIDYFERKQRINYGVISKYTSSGFARNYLSDVNEFVSGNSLCFNLKMFDNVSSGVYIDEREPTVDASVKDDFTGSVQKWHMMVDDTDTGFIKDLGFSVFHFEQDYYFRDKMVNDSEEEIIKDSVYKNLFKLPYFNVNLVTNANVTNLITGKYEINKDNKEIIDMTFQIEPITDSEDILFSQWLVKLSNMLDTYDKFDTNVTTTDIMGYEISQELIYTNYVMDAFYHEIPMFIFNFDKDKFDKFDRTKEISIDIMADYSNDRSSPLDWMGEKERITEYHFHLKKKKKITDEYIEVEGTQTLKLTKPYWGGTTTYNDKRTLKLKKVTSIGSNYNVPSNKVMFTNIIIIPDTISSVSSYEWAYPENKITCGDKTPNDTEYRFSCGKSLRSSELINADTCFFNSLKMSTQAGIKKTYLKNMFIRFDKNKLEKNICYNEYAYGTEAPDFFENLDVKDVLSIDRDSDGKEYINISLKYVPNDTKSLQYWFLDGINYVQTKNNNNIYWRNEFNKASYKFVFGINLTNKDFENGSVKVYMSLLSQRDKRVYDINHNLIGNVYNHLDGDDSKKFGSKQYYCDIINNERE